MSNSDIETDQGAAMSAGWFWGTNRLNAPADADRFINMTKRINGGGHGLAERKRCGKARAVLA